MRSWYILYDGKENKCEFVSVNTLKKWVWLRFNGVTFKVAFTDIKDYQDAKRGIISHANAMKNNTLKLVKVVFK